VAEILGVGSLVDGDYYTLLSRMTLDLVFAWMLIRGVYVRLYGRNEYVFTYFVFNLITFALSFLLRKVPVELGFALGLFALFGILRYRTDQIRPRDLTYLFAVIGLGIMNALATERVSLAELLTVNVAIVGLAALLELAPFSGREDTRVVLYDNIELLRGHDQSALIEDLRQRTGLDVQRISIQQIDLLRDVAQIIVYFGGKPRR
jgi:hypothetical protein